MRTADWTALADAFAVVAGAWMIVKAIYRFLVGIRDNTAALRAMTLALEKLAARVDRIEAAGVERDRDIALIKSTLNGISRRR